MGQVELEVEWEMVGDMGHAVLEVELDREVHRDRQ